MRVVMFYHSLVSEWNHGNAHFLRGIVRVLTARGHSVAVYEPRDGWSRRNLLHREGTAAIDRFRATFPGMRSQLYDLDTVSLEQVLEGADLVLVHEWNDPALVAAIGRHRGRKGDYALLFHDTHHRSVSRPEHIGRYDLSDYDGVLAFGQVIQEVYVRRGWARRAWVWHEAADVHLYRPLQREKEADVIWIGNWGDGERSEELEEHFVRPVSASGASATVCGVRYPDEARRLLRRAGIRYRGWAGAAEVVEQYARHRMTVHVPRRYYARVLTGIPTIRVFEALACGIPLISAPWCDSEQLFAPGRDYLIAWSGAEMREHMAALKGDASLRTELAARGRETILDRHTCEHRVDELMCICRELGLKAARESAAVRLMEQRT